MIVGYSWVFALVTALAFGKTAAPRPNPAATALEREEKRAKAAYDNDDYATAATLYEKLWDEARVPKFLYIAGLAREGLGHSAHALMHWNRFLQLDITDDERKKAEARISTIQQRATHVVVTVEPVKLAEFGGTLEYQYVGPQTTKNRVPLSVSAVEASRSAEQKLALYLEPGTWELKFTPDEEASKSYAAAEQTVNVAAGQKTLELQMRLAADVVVVDVKIIGERPRGDISLVFRDLMGIEPDVRVEVPEKSAVGNLRVGRWEYDLIQKERVTRTEQLDVANPGALLDLRLVEERKPWSPEAKTRLKLGLGLGMTGLAVGAAGAVILIKTESRLKVLFGHELDTLEEKQDVGRTNDLSAAGAGMLGSTIGLWTGAITGAIRLDAKRAWLVELGLGGAAFGGGLAWSMVTGASYGKGVGTPEGGPRWPSVVGAGVAGFGVGLMGSAIAGLIVQRAKKKESRRYSLGPAVSYREIGFQVYGRF